VFVTAESPLVSVVLATNRFGPYLTEALESVAAQTYPNVDVIVVLNGVQSPEAIEHVVQRTVPGATLIALPQANVSIARNVGIARAVGQYVAFLDDDDRWHPERLAAQIAALEARPDACASYCGMRTIDESGRVLLEADQYQVDRLDIARRKTGIISPNLMARRSSLIEVGGVHPRARLAQDLDLVLKLAALGPMVFVDRALVDYRAHPNNNTGSHRKLARSIQGILMFHREMARVRDQRDLVRALTEGLRRNRRYAWWRAARSARQSATGGQPLNALGELIWALGFAPTGLVDGAWRRLMDRRRRG
jgi:glycosyltransferase involved in cell wall biosynthesis